MVHESIFAHVMAYTQDAIFTEDVYKCIHHNYNNEKQLTILIVGFLGDMMDFEPKLIEKRLFAKQYEKFRAADTVIDVRGMAQQYVRPTISGRKEQFITQFRGASEKHPFWETEFVGNLFYIATEQIYEWISVIEATGPTLASNQYQVVFLLPHMPNGDLFTNQVIDAAKAWFRENRSNVILSAVIDVDWKKSPFAN